MKRVWAAPLVKIQQQRYWKGAMEQAKCISGAILMHYNFIKLEFTTLATLTSARLRKKHRKLTGEPPHPWTGVWKCGGKHKKNTGRRVPVGRNVAYFHRRLQTINHSWSRYFYSLHECLGLLMSSFLHPQPLPLNINIGCGHATYASHWINGYG